MAVTNSAGFFGLALNESTAENITDTAKKIKDGVFSLNHSGIEMTQANKPAGMEKGAPAPMTNSPS